MTIYRKQYTMKLTQQSHLDNWFDKITFNGKKELQHWWCLKDYKFVCSILNVNHWPSKDKKYWPFSKKRPIRKAIRISIIGNTMLCCQSLYLFIDTQVYIINNYYILQLFWPNRTLWRYLWPYFLALLHQYNS